jgi:antitoxin component YwqK of YwqJK toxin-antitoxin module
MVKKLDIGLSTIKPSSMPKDITPYNHKGERHGLWIDYFDNGQLSCKGQYLNGQQHGLWESYWDNGKLDYKGTYLNGKEHGPWEAYYFDGNLMFKGTYLNGKRIGYWIINNKTLFYI